MHPPPPKLGCIKQTCRMYCPPIKSAQTEMFLVRKNPAPHRPPTSKYQLVSDLGRNVTTLPIMHSTHLVCFYHSHISSESASHLPFIISSSQS